MSRWHETELARCCTLRRIASVRGLAAAWSLRERCGMSRGTVGSAALPTPRPAICTSAGAIGWLPDDDAVCGRKRISEPVSGPPRSFGANSGAGVGPLNISAKLEAPCTPCGWPRARSTEAGRMPDCCDMKFEPPCTLALRQAEGDVTHSFPTLAGECDSDGIEATLASDAKLEHAAREAASAAESFFRGPGDEDCLSAPERIVPEYIASRSNCPRCPLRWSSMH